MRRLRRPEEEERLEDEASAPEPAPLGLLRLQQTAGNAAVTRLLARQGLADPFTPTRRPDAQPEVEPHAEGQDADTPNVLQSPVMSAGPMLGEATPEAAPPAPTPEQAITDWSKESPTTNPEYATWVLKGEGHGFVSLKNDTKKQLETWAAGGKAALAGGGGGTVDGSASVPLLGVLETIHGIAAARATRWLSDTKKPKQALAVFWMARNLKGGDAHSTGASIDAGGIDFTKQEAAAQVVQILEDLPAGGYKIGLPFQGPFFNPLESLMHYTNKAKEDAGEKGTPADVTTPGLVEWESPLSTAKWDKDKGDWVVTRGGGSALSKIKDSALRTKLGGFGGKTFMLFPDRPNHIHIQRT